MWLYVYLILSLSMPMWMSTNHWCCYHHVHVMHRRLYTNTNTNISIHTHNSSPNLDLRLRIHLLLLLLLLCRLRSRILLHLRLKPQFIRLCKVFKLLLLLGLECPPPLAQYPPHLNKFNTGELLHDIGTHFVGEEYVGARSAFGCIGVLGGAFVAFSWTCFFNEVSAGIVAWWWGVDGHFVVVSHFILFGSIYPYCLFFGC
mmetsp:Transcript_23127/g.29165  ORF Transcript_23127/g.29165 Transcript_23127/m.29165 type:complete len:201 (+) Transcript_23127:517-1119(+)